MYYKREKGILLFVIFYLQTHEGDILMTRTKTTKLVAIVMAVFMAFTFFCFSVVTTVRAEDGEDETGRVIGTLTKMEDLKHTEKLAVAGITL